MCSIHLVLTADWVKAVTCPPDVWCFWLNRGIVRFQLLRGVSSLCGLILKCIYTGNVPTSLPPSHHRLLVVWSSSHTAVSLYVRTWNLPAFVMYLMPLKGLYFSPYMSSRFTFSPVKRHSSLSSSHFYSLVHSSRPTASFFKRYNCETFRILSTKWMKKRFLNFTS